MESFEGELDFEIDLDDIISDKTLDAFIGNTTLDDFLNNSDLKSAIEEVGLGCNDDYERQLIEQKKKREEYLQYKEQRRRESKEDRLRAVLIEKRELEEQMKSNQTQKENNQRIGRKPMRQKFKPMQRIDTNVKFNSNGSDERQNKRLPLNNSTDRICRIKKQKIEPKDTQNKDFGCTTVLIRNLAPETNEFTICHLGECVGKVLGVCIALEEGVRKAMARFESPVDALLFQRKFNNYKLDSTYIKTSLIA